MVNSTGNKNIRGSIAYRYLSPDFPFSYSPMIFNFSKTSQISTNQSFPSRVYYVEGQVIFEEDYKDGCQLGTFNSSKPYEFTTDLEIVHLTNSYDETTKMVTQKCNWKFIAPKGYGFKIVVTTLEIDKNTRFIVENETDILLNENSFKPNHPLYNSDTQIQIHLLNTDPFLHFQAYVSIVKTDALVRSMPCKFVESVGFEWYTYKWNQGPGFYGNNQECSLTIVIKHGYEFWVNFVSFLLGEVEADYVEYSVEDGESVRIDYNKAIVNVYSGFSPYSNADFMLLPHKNKTEKRVTWKFVSDGSNPGVGFDILFRPIICQCVLEIPCNDLSIWPVNNSQFYCSNMECEINIAECKENELTLFVMTVVDASLIGNDDYFQVFSNNVVIYELRSSNIVQPEKFVILKSSNKNVLKFQSFYSEHMRSITFTSSGFDAPNISDHITLSSDKPLYVMDGVNHKLVVIEISDDQVQYNYTVQIYRMYFGYFYLYNNESLTHEIHAICDDDIKDHLLFMCKLSNIKKFVIFFRENSYSYAVIQLMNRKHQCVFNNILYHPKPSHFDQIIYENYTVSDISSVNESCVITVLLDPGETTIFFTEPAYIPRITKVWTTSPLETVKIFTGAMSQPLFEFNSTTHDYWKDIVLNTLICIIEIPKNSSLLVYISNTDSTFDGSYKPKTFHVTQYPYYSVMRTSWRVPFGIYQSYFSEKYPLKFTVKHLDILKYYVWLEVGNETNLYRFNQTNDSYIFQNQVITFGYHYDDFPESIEADMGAMILIESLNDTIIQ